VARSLLSSATMQRARFGWWLVPLALTSGGCVSAATGAQRQLSKDVSCPENRIGVRPLRPPVTLREPPAAVASDAARLALWRRDDAERHKKEAEQKYFVAEGCGEQRLYRCYYCVQHPGRMSCGVSPICVDEPMCFASTLTPDTATCAGP